MRDREHGVSIGAEGEGCREARLIRRGTPSANIQNKDRQDFETMTTSRGQSNSGVDVGSAGGLGTGLSATRDGDAAGAASAS